MKTNKTNKMKTNKTNKMKTNEYKIAAQWIDDCAYRLSCGLPTTRISKKGEFNYQVWMGEQPGGALRRNHKAVDHARTIEAAAELLETSAPACVRDHFARVSADRALLIDMAMRLKAESQHASHAAAQAPNMSRNNTKRTNREHVAARRSRERARALLALAEEL